MSTKPKGIAARAGHWSARHRKTAIFGWLALHHRPFVVGGVARPEDSRPTPRSWTARPAAPRPILEDAGFPKKSGEMVLVQSKTKTVKDPAFKAAVNDVAKTVGKQSGRRQRHHRHRLRGRALRARPVRPQG